jgi:hypothetical protein
LGGSGLRNQKDPLLYGQHNDMAFSGAKDARESTSDTNRSPYLDFLLERLIHDFGNSVSGILSLADYHLRAGVTDPALEDSLRLVYESADGSRRLLILVAELLEPVEQQEAIVVAAELIGQTGKKIATLLPRTVTFESSIRSTAQDTISVRPGAFSKGILNLVALDLAGIRVPTGKIQLGSQTINGKVHVFYRSLISPSEVTHRKRDHKTTDETIQVLGKMSETVAISSNVEGGSFTVALVFPTVS